MILHKPGVHVANIMCDMCNVMRQDVIEQELNFV